MAEEKVVQSRNVRPGVNISQGRGGSAVLHTTDGSIMLTSNNAKNELEWDINSSYSSIIITGDEDPQGIASDVTYSSTNFYTINNLNTQLSPITVQSDVKINTSSPESKLSEKTENTNVIPVSVTSSLTSSITLSSVESVEDQALFALDEEEPVTFILYGTGSIAVTDESVVNITDGTRNNYTGGTGKETRLKYTGKQVDKAQTSIYIDNVPYLNQPNGWTCLITSTIIISGWSKSYADSINFSLFLNPNNSGKLPYVGSGNNLQFYLVLKNFPKFKRPANTNVNDPFNEYIKIFKQIKKPMIIRVAGIGVRSRGHWVVLMGLSKDENTMIIHDPANKTIANSDQQYYKGRMLKKGEATNGSNFDYIYINE